jgi:hypothetical protein
VKRWGPGFRRWFFSGAVGCLLLWLFLSQPGSEAVRFSGLMGLGLFFVIGCCKWAQKKKMSRRLLLRVFDR